MTLGLGQHQLIVAIEVCAVAEGRKTVLVSTVLEEQVSGILMNFLILWCKSDVALQVEEGLIGISLDLQALSSLEVGLGVFFI